MKVAGAFAVAVAAAASATEIPSKVQKRASSSSSGSLPTITTKGNAFYAGDERFYIRGVDYQPGGSAQASDPLADPSTCKRDITYFKQLKLNTIRVYTVDNSANHDECMAALAEANIYLALDVNTPLYSLSRTEPGESYNPTYLQSVFATIDAFAGYSNTLLFFSGNEVINAANTTATAPFIKAVNRDMKQYIGERGYRSIPVGYSAADVAENQYLMAQYMDCGDDTAARSDFYAINNYEWCDPSSYEQSGWSALVEQYKNYSQPLFMSEYGCITNTRTFAETHALYQSDMTSAFSGGLVYEYAEETNGYGLVKINGNSVTPVGSQFSDLQKQLASTTNPSGNGGAVTTNGKQSCPGQSENWDTKPFTSDALPAMPSGAAKYLKSGAGKPPGLNGGGSQQAGGGSTATASANAGSVSQTYGSGPSSTGSVTNNDASSSGSSSSSASSGSAAPMSVSYADVRPVFVCGLILAASFAFGAVSL